VEVLTATVENGSAVPPIGGRSLLMIALLVGVVITGAGGRVVFTVKVTGAEGGLLVLKRSVAIALIVYVPSARALDGEQLQLPAAEVVPEQTGRLFESVTATVEDASAVPEMVGRVLFINELLVGAVITGAAGGPVLTVKVTELLGRLSVPW
jgi:hypothetical protein